MHIFGLIGTIMFILGFLASIYLGLDKLFRLFILDKPTRLITDSPYFYISLTSMILGTQLFLAGFLGELIVRSDKDRKIYSVQKELNLD